MLGEWLGALNSGMILVGADRLSDNEIAALNPSYQRGGGSYLRAD